MILGRRKVEGWEGGEPADTDAAVVGAARKLVLRKRLTRFVHYRQ